MVISKGHHAPHEKNASVLVQCLEYTRHYSVGNRTSLALWSGRLCDCAIFVFCTAWKTALTTAYKSHQSSKMMHITVAICYMPVEKKKFLGARVEGAATKKKKKKARSFEFKRSCVLYSWHR